MSQADYAIMTNEQLKHYIVKHQGDKAAFKAYLERRDVESLPVIANVRDVDFDDKLRVAIAQKLGNSSTT